MYKNKKQVEETTSDLFPRIHQKTTQKELDNYRRNISFITNQYTGRFKLFDIIKNKNILEVGCGGRASGIYALENFHPKLTYAVDLSKKNVKNTYRLCKKFGFKNTVVIRSNALSLAFKDNTFDFVFSNGVIHHTIDPYKSFLEMVRVLSPNGYLFLGIYGYGGIWGKIIHPLGRFVGKIIPLRYTEKFINFTGLMKSQEFSILDWFYAPIQKTYKKEEILNWFKKNGFDRFIKLKCPPNKWFYNMGILSYVLFGDGYIYVIGHKIDSQKN